MMGAGGSCEWVSAAELHASTANRLKRNYDGFWTSRMALMAKEVGMLALRSGRFVVCLWVMGLAAVFLGDAAYGQVSEFVPVTDEILQDPPPDDWLMWRRTLNGWGYSPLDEINGDNVGRLQMVWSRGLGPGLQQGTPLVRNGVMYMPNPRDVIQAIDAATGDLRWEYRRDRPDDLEDYMLGSLTDINRNLAIYGSAIIDTSGDDYVFALDVETGELIWETEILDYRINPANQSSGPIIANGKVISGRGCTPRGGPNACVIVAHDATTGEELWRRRTIPAPGEPGDETWGGVPFEDRKHVGAWMVPSYDPELNFKSCMFCPRPEPPFSVLVTC